MGFDEAAEQALHATIDELRSVLADLSGLDLWPPWDAAETLVGLVAQAYGVATEPPPPEPTRLRDTAEEWRLVATTVRRAHDDLDAARVATTPAIWEGQAGDSFRSSVQAFATRVTTVPVAADGVAAALEAMADQLDAARKRHGDAWHGLREHLAISWSDALPWELADKLAGIVGEVVEAVRDLIGAYEDAADAAAVARSGVVEAMDGITLPDHLPAAPGIDAVSLVNGWADDRGPLEGSALSRYDGAFGELEAGDQQAVHGALAAAGDGERAWIVAGVAGGLSGVALTRYLAQLRRMSPAELAAMDPTRFRDAKGGQPDDTTCGSSTLVMARMVNDPAYAMYIATGYDPTTGTRTGTADEDAADARFTEAALSMHEKTNSWTQNGQPQVPWPQAWGTTPGAVVNEMNHGSSGVPGTSYDMRYVDPDDRAATYDAIAAASEDGHAVPIFIGDDTSPRHVVLVTGANADHLTVYDPFADRDPSTGEAVGRTVTVSRDDWAAGDFSVAGWEEPWGAVLPEG